MDSGFNMLGQFQGDSSLGLGSFQGNSQPTFEPLSLQTDLVTRPAIQPCGHFKDYDSLDEEAALACFGKAKEDLKRILTEGDGAHSPEWIAMQKQINETFEARTAWEPKNWQGGSADGSLRNYVKSSEIDVESLWSVRPEIKNKFL